ncbi:16S rRNA m(7)G-527 methyltransferase [Natranaerovirga pectinivora]|uniref:Ribosomal RNA small subunit methyltransferase G n=1 Tax=Natranaerovirga pectinivora TaxID=682400 RepID=A0A4R3MFG1_9FIRM|nr:16S rRNA (guanine(527)-N(7))-methyltransferase RsmG [Natranaerovirga pectinivora]TCT12248.1 16S rRNA m(7)G-527 methyltransferase [Natranaerovirga pectinivora]
MTTNNIDILDKYFNWLEIDVKDEYKNKFFAFYEMLIEWNKNINLTAITDFNDVILKHFVDSLLITKVVQLDNKKIIDIGTGAGFPGIPIKIINPKAEIVLVDSLNKRVNFLNEVINKLELDKIRAVHSRAEDIGQNRIYREKYDFCVSRAVANLATLSEYCLPLVKKDGYFIPYKSGEINDEINNATKAVKILGGKIEKVPHFTLLDTDINRSFVVIKKEKKTPSIYPRKAGKPSKEPLS